MNGQKNEKTKRVQEEQESEQKKFFLVLGYSSEHLRPSKMQ
jgi:hypothetical protein